MIDFSIIIPAYNLEGCIEKTLESICKNKLDNVEIIVVDDGSKDNTAIITKEYLADNRGPHFEVISQKNKGVSGARNAGIAKAKGRYLIFCDGDDLCAEDMIETIQAYKDMDYDMLVWRYDILQGDKRRVSQKAFGEKVLTNQTALKSFLLGENRIRLGSFAVKKSLLKGKDIEFTEGCAIAEDVEFMYKCLAVSETVQTIDSVLYTYIKRDGSAMNQFDWKRFQAPAAMRRVYDYVKDNTDIFMNEDMEDYLHNGLYLLHCLFSFESCIQYLKGCKDAKEFVQTYMTEYRTIEAELKRVAKEMRRRPSGYSKFRMLLFCFSRRIYVYYYVMRAGK